MEMKQELESVTTTIGDLVAIITEIALKAGKTEEEGYTLASLTLEHILNAKQSKSQPAHWPVN